MVVDLGALGVDLCSGRTFVVTWIRAVRSIGHFFWCCGLGFGGVQVENLLTSNATAPKKMPDRPRRPAPELGSWGAGELGSWELGSWELVSWGLGSWGAGELGAGELVSWGGGELGSWGLGSWGAGSCALYNHTGRELPSGQTPDTPPLAAAMLGINM